MPYPLTSPLMTSFTSVPTPVTAVSKTQKCQSACLDDIMIESLYIKVFDLYFCYLIFFCHSFNGIPNSTYYFIFSKKIYFTIGFSIENNICFVIGKDNSSSGLVISARAKGCPYLLPKILTFTKPLKPQKRDFI